MMKSNNETLSEGRREVNLVENLRTELFLSVFKVLVSSRGSPPFSFSPSLSLSMTSKCRVEKPNNKKKSKRKRIVLAPRSETKTTTTTPLLMWLLLQFWITCFICALLDVSDDLAWPCPKNLDRRAYTDTQDFFFFHSTLVAIRMGREFVFLRRLTFPSYQLPPFSFSTSQNLIVVLQLRRKNQRQTKKKSKS